MFWQVAWSLVLGFLVSSAIQALVSRERMSALFGRDDPKAIALATVYGAASSSCSYASAAIAKTIFKKGGALIPSLAFMFASTNLVVELGIVLWILMGWRFAAAEWIGGVVLIVVLSLFVKATYPKKLVEEARAHVEGATAAHDHEMTAGGATFRERLRDPRLPVVIAQTFAMDWSMLQWDLLAGFLIAGAITAFVPDGLWHALFMTGAPPGTQVLVAALIGPLIAIVTFVCSIGNVPMAAVLWSGGLGFSGVIAFLYADLIVLPLLDVYRKYYGLRMAAYIGVAFYITMVVAAIVVDLGFRSLGMIPAPDPNVRAELVHFAFDYTFWLNVIFGAAALAVVVMNRRNPMGHEHHCH